MRHVIAVGLLLLPVSAWGQEVVVNPRRATFDASPDHATPLLARYELRHYVVGGGPAPVSTWDLGKPSLVGNQVEVSFPAVSVEAPSSPTRYFARVVSIGPEGENASEPSGGTYVFAAVPVVQPTLAGTVLSWTKPSDVTTVTGFNVYRVEGRLTLMASVTGATQYTVRVPDAPGAYAVTVIDARYGEGALSSVVRR